ncbi:MAG: DNA topoisomerase-1 [Alphaproteobacteria bacterium]|jgi:DNA topoisomerase-1
MSDMTQPANVVIVESPAKAKTINKYLGTDYHVLASFGHVRDLPSKNGSVDTDDNFKMIWEVSDTSKKHLAEITKAVKGAEKVILATDPDREGEAISWHLLQYLTEKKLLKNKHVERVTFNEITKSAILTAMSQPRMIDDKLVDAYLARRALDYLVGFNLSPVLWRKLPGARSAGRVQSVALRLVTEREQEIEQFKSDEYWTIENVFIGQSKTNFKSRLVMFNKEKIKKLSINNETQAFDIKKTLLTEGFSVTNIEAKPVKRHPTPPFITSTLQQEAARKLGFSASHTMKVAQKLYEDGYITYMRTDGVTLSSEAIGNIRSAIADEFGKQYVPTDVRVYKSKVKNAQEAHEAIRPTDITQKPIAVSKDSDKIKLYTLIRNRTLACQMESATTERTTVTINNAASSIELRTTGTVIVFDGFLKLYLEGRDETSDDEDDAKLPSLKIGEALKTQDVLCHQHFTEPAPRFSEASLVKKMEELGIGRPSTYASVLSVLRDRQYVTIEKNRFIPEDKGRIVTCFLEDHFKRYVEYDFTADLEERLDKVSDGQLEWLDLMADFWQDFKQAVDATSPLRITAVIDRLNEVLHDRVFPPREDKSEPRSCPACKEGTLSIRLSKFGAFVGCSRHPDCAFTRSLTATGTDDIAQAASGPIIIGQTEDGQDIVKKVGRFGPYLEYGTGKEVKRGGIPKFYQADEMTEELARKLLNMPRLVGQHPETKLDIISGFGRFGAYIAHDGVYGKIQAEDVLSIGINHAVTIIAEKAAKGVKKGGASSGKKLGEHDKKTISLKSGRYGAYVTDGKLNATLPDDIESETCTLEQAIDLLDKKAEASGKKPKKAPAKKTPAKKTPAKKPAAKKPAAKKATAPKEE